MGKGADVWIFLGHSCGPKGNAEAQRCTNSASAPLGLGIPEGEGEGEAEVAREADRVRGRCSSKAAPHVASEGGRKGFRVGEVQAPIHQYNIVRPQLQGLREPPGR